MSSTKRLSDRKTFRHGMDMLRSELHQICGIWVNKVSLSPFDSKQWIAKNKLNDYNIEDVAQIFCQNPKEK